MMNKNKQKGDLDNKEKVRRILESPTYRRADEDIGLLARNELRATRLQLEFLKPELILEEHNILHTIVVLGSARIVEPNVARYDVETARKALEDRPEDSRLKQTLAVAERLLAKSRYYDVAREFGRIVGRVGNKGSAGRLVIVTGGGPGLMEAANRGADEVGAQSIGLNITLPLEQFPNPYITPELCFQFRYFALRKMHFMMRAKALVVFPGGYGTIDELFDVLTLIQTRKVEPHPVILVGEDYWRRVIDFQFLVDEGMIDPEDRDLFQFAESAEEIWGKIKVWYKKSGQPLLG